MCKRQPNWVRSNCLEGKASSPRLRLRDGKSVSHFYECSLGCRLRSSHHLKSRTKACSDRYRSEGHQSVGKFNSCNVDDASPRKQWVSYPENELRMGHLVKFRGTPETVRLTILLA